ncbi:MAG: GGDEF domain-containing protein [Thauera sp.]|nr:GGDEF domain-containing protein [Thauera sp.]
MRIPYSRPVLALWLTVALLSVVNVVGWFWQEQSVRTAELAKATREAEIANDAFAEQTVQVINLADTVLRGVREHWLQTGSLAETRRYIDALTLKNSLLDDVFLVDREGLLALTHDDGTHGVSVRDRGYFRFHAEHADDRLYIAPVELGRVTRQYLFRITRRVTLPDGSFGGVVLTTLAPDALSDYYQRLTRDDGSVTNLIGTEDQRLRARRPAPAAEVWEKPIASGLWQALSRAPSGTYRGVSSVDGIDRHYVYRRIESLPLAVVTGFSTRTLEQTTSAAMRPITAAAAFLNLVALVFAGIMTVVFRQRDALQRLATTDVLTGVANRRDVVERATREVARARRYGTPLVLAMLDIDHFKRVNDRYGHATGDRVLKALAGVAGGTLRRTDIFGRLGGEEFLFVLPQTARDGARVLADRLRAGAEACASALDDDGAVVPFTVSIGLAAFDDPALDFDALLSRADKALYRAKADGRNRIAEFAPPSGAASN